MRATDKTDADRTEAVQDDPARDDGLPDEAARDDGLPEEAARVEVHRDEAARDESDLFGPRDDSTKESIVDIDEPGPPAGVPMPDVPTHDDETLGVSDDRPETVATELLPAAEAEGIRDRWRDVQLRFVDDPRTAAEEAATLVDDVTQSLVTAIESRRSELGSWRDNSAADPGSDDRSGQTEQLRIVVQRYREFIDRVLGV